MTWSLEDIERDWICEKVSALAVSPDSVVAAFDRTERDLGWEWIEKSRISVGNIVRRLSPTLRVVNEDQKLAVLENVRAEKRDAFFRRVEELLRPELFRDQTWIADYGRLRFAVWK
jgi:hypothetical protein